MIDPITFYDGNIFHQRLGNKKHEFTKNILDNDLYPHCFTKEQKIYFLGSVVKVLPNP